MFEKVNMAHPDKVADRIAGALVDLAYDRQDNPKVAIEVMIGHGHCTITSEASVKFTQEEAEKIVQRITGRDDVKVHLIQVKQDPHLAENQANGVRCGDNGVFRGCPETWEEKNLVEIAKFLYGAYGTDGKYIIYDDDELIICQSCAKADAIRELFPQAKINPIGDWTGSIDVDTGCTNRKLGSDMGNSVTGSGLHGKDLSKADVSVNIWCWLQAQETGKPIEACCAIGDTEVNGVPYAEIVETARQYIEKIGGFERFAEWGLLR